LLVNYQWQIILQKHKIKIDYWYTLKNIFIGYFYGFITPGGFGAYLRAYYLKGKTNETLQKCTVNIILFNTVDYISLLILGLTGAFIISSRIQHLLPIIIALFLVIIILTITLLRADTGKKLFQRVLETRLLSTIKDKWSIHLDEIYNDLPGFKDLTPSLIISLIGWVIWITILYLIAMVIFHIQVSYLIFFAVISVTNILASIPVSIYGLGTREAALIGLFALYNVEPEKALAFSIYWFILSWLIPSIIGAAVTLHEGAIKKE